MTLVAVLSTLIGLLLGLLGGGGSILTLPMLVYLVAMEPKAAIVTSLIVVGTTSAVAMLGRALAGEVCWKTGLLFGLAGMAGAYAGGRFSHFLPNSALLLLFALIMFATGLAMLGGRRRIPDIAVGEPLCPRDLPLVAIVYDGILVGSLTGLVGAGGGFLIVPALTLLGRLPLQSAINTSLLVLTLQSFAALAGHAGHAHVDAWLTAMIVGATVSGSLVGGLLGKFIGAAALRRLFGLLVIAVASYLVYRETGSLPEQIGRLVPLFMAQTDTRHFWLGLTAGASGLLALFGIGAWLHAPRRTVRTTRLRQHTRRRVRPGHGEEVLD